MVETNENGNGVDSAIEINAPQYYMTKNTPHRAPTPIITPPPPPSRQKFSCNTKLTFSLTGPTTYADLIAAFSSSTGQQRTKRTSFPQTR